MGVAAVLVGPDYLAAVALVVGFLATGFVADDFVAVDFFADDALGLVALLADDLLVDAFADDFFTGLDALDDTRSVCPAITLLPLSPFIDCSRVTLRP